MTHNIVLNRMYTGDYLSRNIGHEVINMFQADDDNHYLYLNARGNLVGDACYSNYMLLVVYLGNQMVEIVGMAKNLMPAPGAMCSLPRDLNKCKRKNDEQEKFIKNIFYNKIALKKIFKDSEQQEIYVSYKVDKENFYVPKRRLVLCFDKERCNCNIPSEHIIFLSEYNFGSMTLHQFIKEPTNKKSGSDFKKLLDLINNKGLWVISNERIEKSVTIPSQFIGQKPTLFDICKINYNENCFSDALAFFICEYQSIWLEFFNSRLNLNLIKLDVRREVIITNNKGRIDLLIECYSSDSNGKPIVSSYIIIENKIKSSIIKMNGESQLDRYWNYVNEISQSSNGEKIYAFVLAPDYNMPVVSDYCAQGVEFKPLYYSDIYKFLSEKIECIIDDISFIAFYNALKRHTYTSKSFALYEDMKQKFYDRINLLKK